MSFPVTPGHNRRMAKAPSHPVVHLELHTANLARAVGFYSQLFGWQPERIDAGCETYRSLELADGLGGGVVECGSPRPLWLPYVEVDDARAATERARELGAQVLLGPREGPAGHRGVVASAAGAEIAFWQPK